MQATRFCAVAGVALFLPALVAAQELEPRALINAPVGMNFFVAAGGYLYGNVLLDPALPIEDGHANLGTLGLGYARSIGVFGKAGKVSLVVPTAAGEWSALVDGEEVTTSRSGFGDPTLKLSVNFVGSPALRLSEFRNYRQSTVVGASLATTIPVGQYDSDKLINLGSNRWSFAPRLGASQVVGRWVFEGYAGGTFYTHNDDFFGGKELTQEPFLDLQAHAIYLIRGAEWWAATSFGYGWGGRSTIDEIAKDSRENIRVSALLRMPLARGHGLKLVYINGLHSRLGADFDTFQVAYQFAWGGKR